MKAMYGKAAKIPRRRVLCGHRRRLLLDLLQRRRLLLVLPQRRRRPHVLHSPRGVGADRPVFTVDNQSHLESLPQPAAAASSRLQHRSKRRLVHRHIGGEQRVGRRQRVAHGMRQLFRIGTAGDRLDGP
jgi:hypothetical protein